MRNYRKDFCIALAAILIVILGAVSVYAASDVLTVQAYRGVKILYNGTKLTSEIEPYIINNTTYVPVRMLMNQFGKDISWESASQQVIIADSTSEVSKDDQIVQLTNENALLQSKITTLNAKISGLDNALENADTTIRDIENILSDYSKNADDDSTNSDTTISDLEGTLSEYFVEAGDDYFGDSGIDVSINLSGDKDELVYAIKLDFNDADNYDDLTELNQTQITSLLSAVKSKIVAKTDGNDYENANITGKLGDYDISSYYVTYNGSSYVFSWDDDNSSISDVADYLNDYFKDSGDTYFSDDGIDVTISLSGDEDDLVYSIYLNFDDAEDYDDLSDVSQSKVRSIMYNVKSAISSKMSATDYEDADITGILIDDDDNSYYVKYNGSSYSFSW